MQISKKIEKWLKRLGGAESLPAWAIALARAAHLHPYHKQELLDLTAEVARQMLAALDQLIPAGAADKLYATLPEDKLYVSWSNTSSEMGGVNCLNGCCWP